MRFVKFKWTLYYFYLKCLLSLLERTLHQRKTRMTLLMSYDHVLKVDQTKLHSHEPPENFREQFPQNKLQVHLQESFQV